jgi:abequosyltransferase
MTKKDILSICIPTYNRANLLYENTLELIEKVRPYNIPIYISDNYSSDNTEKIALNLKNKYDEITYFRHNSNIHDMNFPFVLRKSCTKYTWLLGDKNRLANQSIERLLSIIDKEDYDIIVVGDESLRVKNIPSKIFTDPNQLLEQLGWHMTLISSLIFSKELITKMDFERYSKTNFIHLSAIFDAIIETNFKVLWLNEPIIEGPRVLLELSWVNVIFEVFFESWANSIFSLSPKYSLFSKLNCIKNHNSNTKLFTKGSFFHLRRKGIYSLNVYKKYNKYFNIFLDIPNLYLLLIALTPIWILNLNNKFKVKLNKFHF